MPYADMGKDNKRDKSATESRRLDTSRSYLGDGWGIERPVSSRPPQKRE